MATSAFLISLGLIDPSVLFLGIMMSTFIILIPQSLFQYERYRMMKEMEARFPSFLRDVVESVRAGSPLHQAIIASSKIDYGALSKEVKKAANQLSWGVHLDKVLQQLATRIGSKRLNMAISTLRETYATGGDIATTLEALADSLTTLEECEKERKALLNQYVVVMYAISLFFIAIVVALDKFMVPIFQIGGLGESTLVDPCSLARGISMNLCDLYTRIASAFGVEPGVRSYYVGLFFLMASIQAFFVGLIIGQITRGSITAGIIHSVILVIIVFSSFGILSYLKLM